MVSTEIELSTFYGPNQSLKAVVNKLGDGFIVDFYKDDVLLCGRTIHGKTLQYCEDLAENYCNGFVSVDVSMESNSGI